MKLLIFKNKYNEDIFHYETDEELYSICLAILWKRWHSGDYYEEEVQEKIVTILRERSGTLAYAFLMLRRDYEYESIYMTIPTSHPIIPNGNLLEIIPS